MEAEGRSELWWSVWSWGSVDRLFSGGARRSFVWSLERLDRASLHSLAVFLIYVCI